MASVRWNMFCRTLHSACAKKEAGRGRVMRNPTSRFTWRAAAASRTAAPLATSLHLLHTAIHLSRLSGRAMLPRLLPAEQSDAFNTVCTLLVQMSGSIAQRQSVMQRSNARSTIHGDGHGGVHSFHVRVLFPHQITSVHTCRHFTATDNGSMLFPSHVAIPYDGNAAGGGPGPLPPPD